MIIVGVECVIQKEIDALKKCKPKNPKDQVRINTKRARCESALQILRHDAPEMSNVAVCAILEFAEKLPNTISRHHVLAQVEAIQKEQIDPSDGKQLRTGKVTLRLMRWLITREITGKNPVVQKMHRIVITEEKRDLVKFMISRISDVGLCDEDKKLLTNGIATLKFDYQIHD